MKDMKRIVFRAVFVLLLLLLAGAMMVIGRGHTVYFDNRTIEYNGQTYSAPYRINVYIKGERIARLGARERGMTTNIGQNFGMALGVIREKGGEEQFIEVQCKLPYNMDGIIINLPAYLAGLDEDAWLSEFIITPEEEAEAAPDDGADGEDLLENGELAPEL